MMGLRLAEGIPRATILSRFGHEFEELFPGLWGRWQMRGWAERPAELLRLTEGGRLRLDGLLQEAMEVAGAVPVLKLRVQWP